MKVRGRQYSLDGRRYTIATQTDVDLSGANCLSCGMRFRLVGERLRMGGVHLCVQCRPALAACLHGSVRAASDMPAFPFGSPWLYWMTLCIFSQVYIQAGLSRDQTSDGSRAKRRFADRGGGLERRFFPAVVLGFCAMRRILSHPLYDGKGDFYLATTWQMLLMRCNSCCTVQVRLYRAIPFIPFKSACAVQICLYRGEKGWNHT